MQSAVTIKGQATIPKAVRSHLGIKAGGQVKFFILPDGRVMLLPVLPASSLRGMLKRPKQRAVAIEEMDEAVGEAVSERFSRRNRG